jgi:hypothetical protein
MVDRGLVPFGTGPHGPVGGRLRAIDDGRQ